jgi:hypothetical protein
MVLEWLRRRDAQFDEKLRDYLFIEDGILEREEALDAAKAGAGAGASPDAVGSLGIGSLRGAKR